MYTIYFIGVWGMNNDKNIDRNKMSVSEIIDHIMQPEIEFLVKNYNNPDATNACLDVASDGIRVMSCISEKCKQYIKDFETLKKMTLLNERKRQEKIDKQRRDAVIERRQESCSSYQEEDENSIN